VLLAGQNYFGADYFSLRKYDSDSDNGVTSYSKNNSIINDYNESNTINIDSTRVCAHLTDGYTYLKHSDNNDISKIDFLIIDAFEDSPEQESSTYVSTNPVTYDVSTSSDNSNNDDHYNNDNGNNNGDNKSRAPPLSIIQDTLLLVKSLNPNNNANHNNTPSTYVGTSPVTYDVSTSSDDTDCNDSNERYNDDQDKNDANNDYKYPININNVFKHGGGKLAINIYGSPSWHEKVFHIIKNNPEFSDPIIIKIKNQKNIILITSRISN
jgi:hypothetical protein